MKATTVTTIVLILFGIFVLAVAAYGYYLLLFTDFRTRFLSPQADDDVEIEAAVQDMRRAIEEYEQERREVI